MKIIELLNKIANGEEIPKQIKYRNIIFEFDNKYKDYFSIDNVIPTSFNRNGVFREIFSIYNNFLNDEVEILEEEKKIPEKLPKSVTDNACSSKDMRLIAITINQLIDYLKSKGDE